MTLEALIIAFENAQKYERHHNYAETMYWYNQYKMLAREAINILKEIKKL